MSNDKLKTPYDIYQQNNEPFAFAGIWNHWVDRSSGEITKTFTILTQDANSFMALIHNTKRRQPIILQPEMEGV